VSLIATRYMRDTSERKRHKRMEVENKSALFLSTEGLTLLLYIMISGGLDLRIMIDIQEELTSPH
jgi:hypothetical protein